jgi:hypothetical protein
MNSEDPFPSANTSKVSKYPILERITACVLIMVVYSVGWMVLAAFQPGLVRVLSTEAEVGILLALLSAALGLVSLVALLHTRR